MSEPTDTTQVDAEPQTDPAATEDTAGTETPTDEPDGGQEAPESPNAEAARWRTRLRETEAQRDQLAEQLAAYQRRECEAAVADLLDVPSDLWEVGQAHAGAFYADDGTLNETELRAAAGALAHQRPRLAKAPAKPPNMGQHGVHYFDGAHNDGGDWQTVLRAR